MNFYTAKFIILMFSFEFFLSEVESARILCVFSMPAASHHSVFREYTKELAKNGHELIIITPRPNLPTGRNWNNITEIDVGPVSNKIFGEMFMKLKYQGLLKRGVILDLEAYLDESVVIMYTKMCAEQLKHPEVVKLINNKNKSFDLIVVEAHADYHLILSHIFKTPVILLSSFYAYPDTLSAFGAVSHHPYLYPHIFRNGFGGVTIWEKCKELYWEVRLILFALKTKEAGNILLKSEFGLDAPSIDELRKNVQMLLLNVHPIYDNNRPVSPSVVYLGNVHLKTVEEIPQELKHYLDDSKNGVIYVSLGTLVDVNGIDKELIDQFVKTFQSLPYIVLWKFDENLLEEIPQNVKIQKWFPQRDLLMHPNIKAFVTHGGIHSIEESIDAAVPMIGIPLLVDQWYNVYRSSELGIAVKLDTHIWTAVDLIKAVKTVVEDESYKHNIIKLRSLLRDQPESPLKRAIWWTEHVLRHGGARHLQAPGAHMSWSEYLMLDVLCVCALILSVLLFIIIVLLRYICRFIIEILFKIKLKQN